MSKVVGAQLGPIHRLASDGYGNSSLLKCSNKREIGVIRVNCNDRRRRSVNDCDYVARIRTDTTCRKQVQIARHLFQSPVDLAGRRSFVDAEGSEEHTSELPSLLPISYAVLRRIKKQVYKH